MTTIRFPQRDEFSRIVDDVLIPSFPDTERPEHAGFMALYDAEAILPLVAFDGDTPLAVSISMWDFFAASHATQQASVNVDLPITAQDGADNPEVILISWLAVGEAGRGQGIGSTLLDATVDHLSTTYDPFLIVLEVEDPQVHTEATQYGDPHARIRFYERAGARLIDVPFALPRIDNTSEVLPGMLLYAIGGSALATADLSHVELGTPLATFLRDYARGSGEPQNSHGQFIHPAISRMIHEAANAQFAIDNTSDTES